MKTSWSTLLFTFLLLAAPAVGYLAGRQVTLDRVELALHRADSSTAVVRDSLRVAIATVRHDTLRVDSLVDRWHRLRDTLIDTLPVPYPVTVERIVHVADSTINGLDTNRRACVATLATCEVAIAREQHRADLATSLYQTRLDDERRAAKYRAIERGACVVSLGLNVMQWRMR